MELTHCFALGAKRRAFKLILVMILYINIHFLNHVDIFLLMILYFRNNLHTNNHSLTFAHYELYMVYRQNVELVIVRKIYLELSWEIYEYIFWSTEPKKWALGNVRDQL